MLGLAAQMLRFRKGSFVATFVALAAGVMILMACGLLVESGLRYHGLPQRYAETVAVVAHRDLTVAGPEMFGETEPPTTVALPERGSVPDSLVEAIAAVPGVASAVGDHSIVRSWSCARSRRRSRPKSAARRHYLRMQTWVLLGVGALILLTILALVLGLWVHAISAGFATELARITLPILLGAAATIVGAFFGVGANVHPGKDFETRRSAKRPPDAGSDGLALRRNEQEQRGVDRAGGVVEPRLVDRVDAADHDLSSRPADRARFGEVAVHAPGRRVFAVRGGTRVWHVRVALLGAKLRE